ncbi:PH domain-containing protein [Salipaludibacillus sp. HK11]|uniref:PH domain-containing protein n=1 Tax=Salipaludibacillus sp. HK11 TaxID=3394320 RepID=UPI0039FD3CF7
MAEETILEFENHLFGIKGKKEGFLKIPKEFYTLTNERLKISKQGMMTETKSDIELFKIKDISVNQKMKDKMMDLGDIVIISSDASDPELTLKKIKGPHDVREKIRSAAKEARESAGVAYRQDV